MSSTMTEQAIVSVAPRRDAGLWTDRTTSVGRYLRRNPTFVVGLLLSAFVALRNALVPPDPDPLAPGFPWNAVFVVTGAVFGLMFGLGSSSLIVFIEFT